MLRVHMTASDNDTITMYFPVTSNGSFDQQGPEPWLFKGTWSHQDLTGELELLDTGLVLTWSSGISTPIDLPLSRQVKVGDQILVTESRVGRYTFTVDDVRTV